MVAGLLLGYLLMKIFPAWNWMMLTLGFVAGLFTGYFWGNRKDAGVRTHKKLM
jgi:F0F1-type ATP synthase assembly protein I